MAQSYTTMSPEEKAAFWGNAKKEKVRVDKQEAKQKAEAAKARQEEKTAAGRAKREAEQKAREDFRNKIRNDFRDSYLFGRHNWKHMDEAVRGAQKAMGIHCSRFGDVTIDKVALKCLYRCLSKKYHPDVNGGKSKKFMELQSAYECLILRTEK